MEIVDMKINTIWKRDMGVGKKGAIIEGDYADPIFGVFPTWHVTEKVDGELFRVVYDLLWWVTHGEPAVKFLGKTDNSQFRPGVLEFAQRTFTQEALERVFPHREPTDDPRVKPNPEVTLFGEAYGKKIQKGGELYRDDVGVILFDVLVDGYWLEYENVADIAAKLGVPVVPSLGVWTTANAINLIKNGGVLSAAATHERFIEGIVATSHPMVLDRKTKAPVKWKLKLKDYGLSPLGP